MPDLHIDFETFSYAPLRTCGAYRYAVDPTTEILCCCWASGNQEVETWVPCITLEQAKALGMQQVTDYTESYVVDRGSNVVSTRRMKAWHFGKKVPKPLADSIARGDTIIAHNAQFERAILQAVVHRRHGGPRTKVRQFACTAARSAAAGLPRSLEGAGNALGTTAQKDVEGAKLLKVFAMPRKPTKADKRTRILPTEQHHDFIRLVEYCQQDVRTERDVDAVVPHLNDLEQQVFWFDMQINERGLLIDIPLVEKASAVVAHLEKEIVHEVEKLTTSTEYPTGIRPTQVAKMLGVFQSMGVHLENMQADHVRKYMKNNLPHLSEKAKRLLFLRMEAGKSSTKKFASMRAFCSGDHRARGTLLFYGAHTGRWSGKGVQPHNFIRGKLKYAEQLRIFELLGHGDHEVMQILYEWPITAISSCMRGFIRAAPGKILRVVDYSAIEARVLAWMAQETEVLKAYIAGLDVYKVMASKLYNVPYEEVSDEQRRIGKNLVLGCGYGLGGAKFVLYSEKAGVEISEEFAKAAVKTYRNGHRNIVRFWGDVERCAIQAVREQRTQERPVVLRNLRFFMERQWLCVRLPSGRSLRYFRPKVVPVEKFGEPALQLCYKTEFRGQLITESTYGGKLVENIIQAIARDVLVHGMLSAERAGYSVIGTVHDEIVTEVPFNHGSVKELEHIVCQLPQWASGLPIGAEGFESERYRKG